MKLYEFVLAADSAVDLADVEAASKWLNRSNRFGGPSGAEVRLAWDEWYECVDALRWAVTAELSQSARPHDHDDAHCKCVFMRHIELIRLALDDTGGLLTFRPSRPTHAMLSDRSEAAAAVAIFFQRVFLSIFNSHCDELSQVCIRCGRFLKKTPGGRKSRAVHCASCKVITCNERNRHTS